MFRELQNAYHAQRAKGSEKENGQEQWFGSQELRMVHSIESLVFHALEFTLHDQGRIPIEGFKIRECHD